MQLVLLMGRHAVWRKEAKKLRRKRLRQQFAAKRDEQLKKEQAEREKLPFYKQWLAEQEAARLFEEEEEKRISQEQEKQWLEREEESQKLWKELQIKLNRLKEERRKQEERIRQEWEEEQRLLKRAKEQKEKELLEKQKQEELFREQIESYVLNGGCMPEELLGNLETNPGKDTCPFFSKVGVCRFGDTCSRNHIRPRISNVILFRGFYSHISLEQSDDSEYGSDSLLEYDDKETHKHFCDFFDDVLPELQKCGCVVQFRVCCNKEAHLRGNVYVEYISPRDAIRAFRLFQGRWYGGKQLNVEFCNISSWRSAICGLSFKKRCPKGSSCNFLHCFRNPGRMFEDFSTFREDRYSEHGGSAKDWRWSVTPEREITHNNNGHRSRRKSPHEYRSRKRSKERKRRSSSRRSRSKSPSRHRKERRSREKSRHRSKETNINKH